MDRDQVPPLPRLGGGSGELGLSVQPEASWPPHLVDNHLASAFWKSINDCFQTMVTGTS